MIYTTTYHSPLGELLLTSDEQGLTGVWYDGQSYLAHHPEHRHLEQETAFHRDAKRWLDIYFSGQEPDFLPTLHLLGSPFQLAVWEQLQRIPFGATTTYGRLATQVAEQQGKPVSPQAVGGAVGRNPLGIIVPCHRVIGANGSLTGYAGGLDKKVFLLKTEGQLLL